MLKKEFFSESHFVPCELNHICENVTASKQAIIHIQVYNMDWARGKNVTITAYVKSIKDIEPLMEIYMNIIQKLSITQAI